MLKSMFQPIVEQKKKSFNWLFTKEYLGKCYEHMYTIYVRRRVAGGNRVVSLNKIIFSLFILWYMKKNKWTTELYQFFLFKFDRCRVFADDLFTYSELAKTQN